MRKGNVIMTTRTCLKCRKDFDSKHIGNRLCVNCNAKNINTTRMDVQTHGSRPKGVKGLTQL